jgi:hypothetical protein
MERATTAGPAPPDSPAGFLESGRAYSNGSVATTMPSQTTDGTGLPSTILLSSLNSHMSGVGRGACAELAGPIDSDTLISNGAPLPWISGSHRNFPRSFQAARMALLRFGETAIDTCPKNISRGLSMIFPIRFSGKIDRSIPNLSH